MKPEAQLDHRRSRLQPGRRSLTRRIWDKISRRRGGSSTGQTMLPSLMRAYAGFCKVDGKLESEEIDSSLEALRYDYPEGVFFELRRYFLQALRETQDLNEIAAELSAALTEEEKVLLGVQLYTLISLSGRSREQLVAFYLFMTNLGVATQAIDIVYQLNTGESMEPGEDDEEGESLPASSSGTLETILFGQHTPADVILPRLSKGCRVLAYRYLTLVMLKNVGETPILVRGRRILPGDFCRVFENQRVVLEEVVVDYADLLFYFNAKKDLHGTQLYISLGEGGDILVEDTRDRNTHLLLQFGLGVKVMALRDTAASIKGVHLNRNTVVEATLQDSIRLDGGREVGLMEMRRRAQHMGGTFRLETNKSDYLISNNASLLRPGDILVSGPPDEKLLLRIVRDSKGKEAELEIIHSAGPIYVGEELVKHKKTISDGEVLTIGDGQYLRCQFAEGIIEEERNIIRSLDVRELSHNYVKKDTALDGIFFTARRGEMICVMGPSGCGKSTLLRVLGGQLKPNQGEIRMNDVRLYDNRAKLTPFICYIPHEDAFDPLLTVEENLDYSAAVRCPELSAEDRKRRADAKLIDLGLNEARHRLAGLPEDKHLSSGERKRLNVGLDMISHADIYLFDEPTSGLSSKDSEHVLDIIRTLAENKIVLVSIHQPSARLFNMFHKAMLLDKGGKLVFFGPPQSMLDYFWETWMEETGRDDRKETPPNLTPDFVFDILETPLRDVSGDTIYETTAEGHLTAARRFPPNFWRDRYQTYNLLENVAATPSIHVEKKELSAERSSVQRAVLERPKVDMRGEWVLFSTMLKRAFLSKLRNKANLFTSLLEAPALGVLIAVILRYSEEDSYSFASAFHIPTYLFLSLVVAMFLGLTNSADEIIRDRVMLLRERNHNVRIIYYLLGKIFALGAFAAVQCVIYVLLGNLILGVRDMFTGYFLWMFMTSMVGVSLGLLVSSLVKDSKTALNIIPMLLIPQILLGGALIKYEEMNTNLDFVYSLHLLPRSDDADEPSSSKPEEPEGSKLRVPLICEFMPLRWSYEAIVITQAKDNPMSRLQDQLESKITSMVSPVEKGLPPPELSDREVEKLNTYKDALALVTALQERNSDAIRRKLRAIADALEHNRFHADDFRSKDWEHPVSADEVYINRKIMEMVAKAEFERLDYRLAPNSAPNVFFGIKRTVAGITIDTRLLNFLVLAIGIGGIMLLLGLILKRQLSRV